MCAGLRVTAETSDLGEIEAELVLEPVDGVAGAASQNTDEVVAGELACLRQESVRKTCAGVAVQLTERFVSSKNSFALSTMPTSCCDWVPAPLIPDVAFVELPPMKLQRDKQSVYALV